jgi:F-type H+-transporting ATPase subunit a
MAFRHFGNVMGGSVITSVLYTALAAASTVLLRVVCSIGWVIPAILIILSAVLIVRSVNKKKRAGKIFGIIFAIIGIAGMLQAFNLLSGIPILEFGLPALFSLYFDFFSGFIQAFVFSLLTMVYIAGACPPEDNAN